MNTCLINPINPTLEVLLHTGGIMSTYSASLVSPETSCSREGPEVTTQPHTLPQVNRKRRRYNKRRGCRQQRRTDPLPNHVIHAIAAHRPTGPKLYLIAGSTIATFSEAHVAAMRWKNEVRPEDNGRSRLTQSGSPVRHRGPVLLPHQGHRHPIVSRQEATNHIIQMSGGQKYGPPSGQRSSF